MASKQHQEQGNRAVEVTHDRPEIGVSACLLGKKVRFDEGHKKSHYILNELSKFLDYVSVCPELEAGFGVPRPTMQLRKQGNEVRLVLNKQPTTDLTSQMTAYASEKVGKLSHLDGFIFKKDSPSCGVFRVPVVVHGNGMRQRNGTGLFAEQFQLQNPLIPVEEEGRLNDAGLRENFFERVYAYRRWKQIKNPETNVEGLINFHAQHKFMLMARGSEYYQELGRMVSGTTRKDLQQCRERYIQRFMEVMKIVSRPGRQVNVLQHIMGYLKTSLNSEDKKELLSLFEAYRNRQTPLDKKELLSLFEAYRNRQTPLITPVTLLRHHLRVNPQQYIAQQHYLSPFPEQLALRSSL
jgi:uncharacterized protein YbgA (DUF1722 family)/uncharacterized protein YbbK (DUF523 family)